MQSSRADARQPSRAFSPANNGTSPGRLRPPGWRRDGSRRLLPPPSRPASAVLAGHPLPVDLSCLGDASEIPGRCAARDPEGIGLTGGPALGARGTADAVLSAATCGQAQAPGIPNEPVITTRCVHTRDSRENPVPAIEGGRRRQATQPDDLTLRSLTDTEFDEVFVLVHPLYEEDWFV